MILETYSLRFLVFNHQECPLSLVFKIGLADGYLSTGTTENGLSTVIRLIFILIRVSYAKNRRLTRLDLRSSAAIGLEGSASGLLRFELDLHTFQLLPEPLAEHELPQSTRDIVTDEYSNVLVSFCVILAHTAPLLEVVPPLPGRVDGRHLGRGETHLMCRFGLQLVQFIKEGLVGADI